MRIIAWRFCWTSAHQEFHGIAGNGQAFDGAKRCEAMAIRPDRLQVASFYTHAVIVLDELVSIATGPAQPAAVHLIHPLLGQSHQGFTLGVDESYSILGQFGEVCLGG